MHMPALELFRNLWLQELQVVFENWCSGTVGNTVIWCLQNSNGCIMYDTFAATWIPHHRHMR